MSDFPDWTAPPQRPEYGKPYIYGVSLGCAGAGTVTIKEIEAKGLLVGGFISTVDADADKDDVPLIKADGVYMASLDFSSLFAHRLVAERSYPLFLTRYDLSTPAFSSGLGIEIPFKTSIAFEYYVSNAVTVTVSIGIIYYLLE
jgi:hypothetical protein